MLAGRLSGGLRLGKAILGRISVAALLCAPVWAEAPKNLDFMGGYFENGRYKCYTEPCLSIHKDTYPAANNLLFNSDDWPGWRDLDGNCQDEDQQTLASASQTTVSYVDDDECGLVSSGSWRDPYSAKMIDDATAMAVDHRISLPEAHYFGGAGWNRAQRLEFVNSPDNLVAVSKAQKEDRRGQPAYKWMPENQAYWCDYVVHRERVARIFGLLFPDKEAEFNQKIKKLYCKY